MQLIIWSLKPSQDFSTTRGLLITSRDAVTHLNIKSDHSAVSERNICLYLVWVSVQDHFLFKHHDFRWFVLQKAHSSRGQCDTDRKGKQDTKISETAVQRRSDRGRPRERQKMNGCHLTTLSATKLHTFLTLRIIYNRFLNYSFYNNLLMIANFTINYRCHKSLHSSFAIISHLHMLWTKVLGPS